MAMSNFINEQERHAELYGKYTDRQKKLLEVASTLHRESYTNDELMGSLVLLGINENEFEWLKRAGHVLPTFL